MSVFLRQRVLQSFKNLHKSRKIVFTSDIYALSEARKKINAEYKKYKYISNESAIEEMIKYAEEVEEELRTTVIQAKEVNPGKFVARIREDTVKLDNIPFKGSTNEQK